MATHLWEHALHSSDRSDFERIIPILRGVAEFFVEYMHKEEGVSGDEALFVMHTGPTTSPENSYTVVSNAKQQADTGNLTPTISS